MSIQILYFASLKEYIGVSAVELEFTLPLTALDIWKQANQNKTIPNNILVAINQEYAQLGSLVKDGDEVAFLPPVTGG